MIGLRPRNRRELRCQELIGLVTDYLEGALAKPERRRFERHLSTCDGCSAYIEQIRQTIALSGRLDADDLEPEVRDGLLRAFRGWSATRG